MNRAIVESGPGREGRGKLRHGVLCLALALLMGCATAKQVQYFEVVGEADPVTGIANRNFYRMTVKGSSTVIGKYDLKAAYVSAETVDTLEGRTPVIPEADLSQKRVAQLTSIREQYGNALLQYAKASAEGTCSDAGAQDKRVVQIAKQMWLASLRDQDVNSIGRTTNTDPYCFRKLVFIATAKAMRFDINRYGQTIDDAINDVSAMAQITRERQQTQAAAKAARDTGLCNALDGLLKADPFGATLVQLFRSQLGVPANQGGN